MENNEREKSATVQSIVVSAKFRKRICLSLYIYSFKYKNTQQDGIYEDLLYIEVRLIMFYFFYRLCWLYERAEHQWSQH